jgi:hypothetical protein
MYGKLINGRLQVAPSRLSGDGVVVYNPPEAMYLAAGYLPVRWTERPAEGEYACAWEQADGEIVQVWHAVEPAPEAELDDTEALNILLGGGAV